MAGRLTYSAVKFEISSIAARNGETTTPCAQSFAIKPPEHRVRFGIDPGFLH